MSDKIRPTVVDFGQFPILPKKYRNEKIWLHVVGIAFPGPKGSAVAVHIEDSKDKNIYHVLVDVDTAKYMLTNDGLDFKIQIREADGGGYEIEVRKKESGETK